MNKILRLVCRQADFKKIVSIGFFAAFLIVFLSAGTAQASFWDWFNVKKANNDSQQATTIAITYYKWVNNGLVSESSGKYTGTCAKKQVATYTCSSSNVGNKLYDGTNRGASYNDVGHAWPIYEGENTSTATEYTWSGCGLDRRTGGQVNEWECKASTTTANSSSSTQASVTVISPDGGEIMETGKTYNIKWNGSNFLENHAVGIALVDQKTFVNTYLFTEITNDGIENWTIASNIPAGSYKMRIFCGIKGSDAYCGDKSLSEDFSNATFTIISGGSSSSSSSTFAGVSAITGGADYDSAHATAYLNGTIYNPNKENVSYYFNYRKETETSSSTKQTVWATINSGSSANVTALTSSLSSGTKYVYRLYAYSYTTGKTVSGDLKSFTTLTSSSSSSSSASSKYNLTINNTSNVSATISLLDIGTNSYINDSFGNLSCSASNGGECNFSVEANHKVKVLSFSYSNGYYYYADWGNAGCSNQGINSANRSYCEVTISANKQIDMKLEKSSSVNSSSSSFKPFIRIISPNGGEVWTQGTTYEIKYQTNVGYSLKIALVKGLYEKKYVMTIGDTTSYSDIATYKWAVPYGMTPGSDYFIRIGSEIGSVDYELSDSPFTISSNTFGSRSSSSATSSLASSASELTKAQQIQQIQALINQLLELLEQVKALQAKQAQ